MFKDLPSEIIQYILEFYTINELRYSDVNYFKEQIIKFKKDPFPKFFFGYLQSEKHLVSRKIFRLFLFDFKIYPNCQLQHVEFLQLLFYYYNKFDKSPIINPLVNLREVRISEEAIYLYLQERLKLKNLQRDYNELDINVSIESIIKLIINSSKRINILYLGLFACGDVYNKIVNYSTNLLKMINKITLSNIKDLRLDEPVDFDFIFENCKNLQHLHCQIKSDEISINLKQFIRLKKFTIFGASIQYFYEYLQQLFYLQQQENNYPQLKFIGCSFLNNKELNNLLIEKNTIPILEKLVFDSCDLSNEMLNLVYKINILKKFKFSISYQPSNNTDEDEVDEEENSELVLNKEEYKKVTHFMLYSNIKNYAEITIDHYLFLFNNLQKLSLHRVNLDNWMFLVESLTNLKVLSISLCNSDCIPVIKYILTNITKIEKLFIRSVFGVFGVLEDCNPQNCKQLQVLAFENCYNSKNNHLTQLGLQKITEIPSLCQLKISNIKSMMNLDLSILKQINHLTSVTFVWPGLSNFNIISLLGNDNIKALRICGNNIYDLKDLQILKKRKEMLQTLVIYFENVSKEFNVKVVEELKYHYCVPVLRIYSL